MWWKLGAALLIVYALLKSKLFIYYTQRFALKSVKNPPFLDDNKYHYDFEGTREEYLDYIESHPKPPMFSDVYPSQEKLVENDGKDWRTVVLWTFGHENVEVTKHFPKTADEIRRHPEIRSAYFSILAPGKIIPPHSGVYKGIVKYHLPVVVPTSGECFIKAGGIRRDYRMDDPFTFDPFYEHTVENNTDETRVILLLEILRTDLPTPLHQINHLLYWIVCNFNREVLDSHNVY